MTSYNGYVIYLPAKRRLWKSLGASGAAMFPTLEAARGTCRGLSGRGALTGAKVMRVASATNAAAKIDGYWVADV